MAYLKETALIVILSLIANLAWSKVPVEPVHVEQLFNPVLVENIKRSVVETLNSPYEYTRNRKNIFENSMDQRRAPASSAALVPAIKPIHEKDEW
ncbi:MAG: hypothetical protein U0T83_03210 [Bacteriovoracaceae bacterium]